MIPRVMRISGIVGLSSEGRQVIPQMIPKLLWKLYEGGCFWWVLAALIAAALVLGVIAHG